MSQCGNLLMLGARVGAQVTHDLEHPVVGLGRAVGGVVGREVRDGEQQRAHFGREPIGLGIKVLLLQPQLPALGLEGFGVISLAGAAQGAHLGREGLDPSSQVVALGHHIAGRLVEAANPLELVEHRCVTPPSQPGAHGVVIVADAADVEHERQR